MSISYRKLLKLLEETKTNNYTLTKKYRVIGQATWTKLQNGGHIDTRTINALCTYFKCQPGDILEWVPDEEEPKE